MAGVLANEGSEVSAHEALARAHREAESFSTLHAEYQSLIRAAQAERWEALLERSGLSHDQLGQVRTSEAHGPLLAALAEAESRGLEVEEGFPALVQARTLAAVEDVASVLHARVERWTGAAGTRRGEADNLIAGLVPRALRIADPDMARALDERETAMEQRARALAEEALTNGASWTRRLGSPPGDPLARQRWLTSVSTVAAYRERWGIGADDRPLGPESVVKSIEHLGQRKRAQGAVEAAMHLSRKAPQTREEPRPDQTAVAVEADVRAAGEGVEL